MFSQKSLVCAAKQQHSRKNLQQIQQQHPRKNVQQNGLQE
jgi:hypothetical protein